MYKATLGVLVCFLGGCAAAPEAKMSASQPTGDKPIRLGNFSVSLAVKDIAASRAFYQKLGFREFGKWPKGMAIMQNDTCTIGLFQGMFDKNMMTFNPGWDRNSKTLADFEDVREIQKSLKSQGIVPVAAADESTTGPGSMVLVDPDGNQIVIDQHVSSPVKAKK